jgi:hypothetical protein
MVVAAGIIPALHYLYRTKMTAGLNQRSLDPTSSQCFAGDWQSRHGCKGALKELNKAPLFNRSLIDFNVAAGLAII